MKKTILTLYIFILPFCNMFSSVSLLGYPLFTWLNLMVFVLSFVTMLSGWIATQRAQRFYFALTVSFFVTIAYSILVGWPITKTITNSIMYFLPFFVFFLIRATNITTEYLIKTVYWGLAIAAVVSVLIGLGIIDGGVHDYTNASLSVYFIDGASGIYALLSGEYLLASNVKIGFRVFKGISSCIFGVVILLFYQSRGRVLVAVALALLMLVLLSYISGAKRKIKLLVVSSLIICVFWVIAVNNDTFVFYFDRIMNRIRLTNPQEDNIAYRIKEIKEYWSMFCSNPFFGSGWGILLNENAINHMGMRYNAHNMYAGLLGVTGLSFAPVLIIKSLSMLSNGFRAVCARRNSESVFALCAILAVILLGIANAGFGKNFCIVFLVTYYVVLIDDKQMVEKKYIKRG